MHAGFRGNLLVPGGPCSKLHTRLPSAHQLVHPGQAVLSTGHRLPQRGCIEGDTRIFSLDILQTVGLPSASQRKHTWKHTSQTPGSNVSLSDPVPQVIETGVCATMVRAYRDVTVCATPPPPPPPQSSQLANWECVSQFADPISMSIETNSRKPLSALTQSSTGLLDRVNRVNLKIGGP